MHRKVIHYTVFIFILIAFFSQVKAETNICNNYHEQINKLWNKKKPYYMDMIIKSGENPYNLYNIQNETNNLLKYASYCRNLSLIDELCELYLESMNTLSRVDQYVYFYYPGSARLSIHPLDKEYRMWLGKQKPLGEESILVSSQFLYLLSEVASTIVDIKKENRSPMMEAGLKEFVPLLVEHYHRWILATHGPFQVRGWGCRFHGKYVLSGMNHFEFLQKKLDKKLGDGQSPAYCNAVTDTDMWIVAGVANLLTVYQKEKTLLNISSKEYNKLLRYVKNGVILLESRFSYTALKDFSGKPVNGVLFDAGVWDEHPSYTFAGYQEKNYPKCSYKDQLNYRGKGVGWDLSHARRFVHVFETLLKNRDVLNLEFPTRSFMEKMANQLVYGAFNQNIKKPLFTNFMDGTNGWYRVGYSEKKGFGYGPWDMSIAVIDGGYGFWSKYSNDIKKVYSALVQMLKSDDPEIRMHVIDHFEINHWSQFKRTRDLNFKDENNPYTQSILLQFFPSLVNYNGQYDH